MISRRSLLTGASAGAMTLGLASYATPSSAATPNWARLRSRLQGRLVLPGNGTYTTAKQLSTAEFDTIDPQAIAYCASPADVALCLGFAQDAGVRVAARSGGHSAAGYSTTTGLVIDVSGLNTISVGAATTTLGAGAQLVDVTNTLAPHGLAVSGGFCPTVALGGFLQGGGMGLLTRHTGISSDTVTAAQVVLADGTTVRASPNRNSDLYWAIRGGGGGNFGVVTAYEVTPTAITDLTLGTVAWDYATAVDVLDGWSRWLPDAPRTIGGAAVVSLPDAAAGNTPTVSVLLSSVGTAAELAAETARLISLVGTPATAQNGFTAPYLSVMMSLYGCGSYPADACHRLGGGNPAGVLPRATFAVERSRLFYGPPPRSMWADAVARFDDIRVAGQQHLIQLGALGGAVDDLGRGDTAYVHRGALFSASFLGVIAAGPADASAEAAARQWAGTGFAIMDPLSSGETYQNFIDPELAGWRSAYYAENYPRLVAVKSKYDPHRVFCFPQAIG
jgi:FAD/FMN-containing dehydrogenase